jgi:hypothetical protein
VLTQQSGGAGTTTPTAAVDNQLLALEGLQLGEPFGELLHRNQYRAWKSSGSMLCRCAHIQQYNGGVLGGDALGYLFDRDRGKLLCGQ